MQTKIASWLDDIFFRSLDWVLLKEEEFVVETTKVGMVMNALSYMQSIDQKGQFIQAIIRGLGGNFEHTLRSEFANEVFNIAGERPADPRNILLNYYDDQS